MGSNIRLVSLVAAVPEMVVAKVGARDMQAAADYLMSFIRGARPIGS
jgi:hypothetical protein